MLVMPNPLAFTLPKRLTGRLRKRYFKSLEYTPNTSFFLINARLMSDYKFVSWGEGDDLVSKVARLQAC